MTESIASHPHYPKFEHLLSSGWIADRKVDNSDAQYSGFRENFLYMLLLLIFHPLLRRIYESFHSVPENPLGSSSQSKLNGHNLPGIHYHDADSRLNRRVSFDLYFATFFIVALHGISALKILSILYVNYSIATRLRQTRVPIATWIFNISILFANELCRGYSLGALAEYLFTDSASNEASSGKGLFVNWAQFLDSYGGLIPRWEILFNFTVLRLVSFNFDFHWSLNQNGGNALEVFPTTHIDKFGADCNKKKQLDPASLSDRERVAIPAKPQDYTFRNFLAYTMYAPLFLTGPILTFNDYISQLRYTPPSITRTRTFLYGVRFIICLLTMEVMIHFIYVVAISKVRPAWEVYTPFQLSMIGFFNLNHIWLKLLLPWRFFRLWALLDGIDPPENMVRCMSDNYSTQAFWRGWHRSFNRWIVRYIYIPLGGSGGPGTRGKWGKIRAMLNFLAVFTFVALWHDISLRLLAWGWLITLFVLPEVLAELLFPANKWQNHKSAYRVICGIGAVGNVLMLMAANLVGFALGLDGLKDLVHGIVGSYSGE